MLNKITKKLKSQIDLLKYLNLGHISKISIIISALKYLMTRKKIFHGIPLELYGTRNIHLKYNSKILIGLKFIGFQSPRDRSIIRCDGSIFINGDISIGGNTRIHIEKNAIANFGCNTSINNDSLILIRNKLEIGNNVAISWSCRIYDTDFHQIENSKINEEVIIGNNVWIGSGVTILKGSKIPNGCVIACNSVINEKFTEENCLIGGIPAKILKKNIKWRR